MLVLGWLGVLTVWPPRKPPIENGAEIEKYELRPFRFPGNGVTRFVLGKLVLIYHNRDS